MLQHKAGKCLGKRVRQAGKLLVIVMKLNLYQQQGTGSLKIQTNNQRGLKEQKEGQEMTEDQLEEKMSLDRTMREGRENREIILMVEDQTTEGMDILNKKENPQDPDTGLMNTMREETGIVLYMKMRFPGDKYLDTETL